MTGPVMMNQSWRDLTFLHWAVDPDEVVHRMPPGVRPDTLDGVTYVGLIPFRMVGAGIARGPGVPWFGSFLETNVRLYSVDDTGRRGIVFLSLDADRAAVVVGARAAFGLPYRWARMGYRASGDVHSYDARLRRPGKGTESHVVVRAGARRQSTELDDFVSARWGLHVRWWGTDVVRPQSPRGLAVARRGGAGAGRRTGGVGGVPRPGRPSARSRGIQPRRAYQVRVPRDATRPRRS